jgi:hypothetical protein
MSSYESTIGELEKQVNDFSKYIKPDDMIEKKDGKLTTGEYIISIKSIKSNDNVKYIVIPIVVCVLLIVFKPKFIMVEELVDHIKVKKISYTRVFLISIVISIVFYLFLKNKKTLLNKK